MNASAAIVWTLDKAILLFNHWRTNLLTEHPSSSMKHPPTAEDQAKHSPQSVIIRREILDMEQAASYLGIDIEALLEEVNSGNLPGRKIGGRWRFSREALAQHLGIYYDWQSIPLNTYTRSVNNIEPGSFYASIFTPLDPEDISTRLEKVLSGYAKGEREFAAWDLSGADLSGQSLKDIWMPESSFRGAMMKAIDLESADLQDADLRVADLSYANLTNADLSGADLRGANLHGAKLIGTDLQETKLTGASLSNVFIKNAKF